MKAIGSINQPIRPHDEHSERFIQALDALDLEAVRLVPKSDLYNHGGLGMRYASLAKIGARVTPPPASFGSMNGFFAWVAGEMRALARNAATIRELFRAAIEDAIEDGVTVLEMSFDLEKLGQAQYI